MAKASLLSHDQSTISPASSHPRNLLGTQYMSLERAWTLLERTQCFAQNAREGKIFDIEKNLSGKTVANLFYEDSTRTRISFETAEKNLGLNITNFSVSGSSVSKGESLKDTVLTLGAMGIDGIVIRHGDSGVPQQLVDFSWTDVPVINAGDGMHEHPTQALLDVATVLDRLDISLKRQQGKPYPLLTGKKLVIVGDIIHSRVARSNMWLFTTLGAQVTLVGPPTMFPDYFQWPVKTNYDFDQVLSENPDILMFLRHQNERMEQVFFPSLSEYGSRWALTEERFEKYITDTPEGLIMHPGPINRGVEIISRAADSQMSTILDQVALGVFTRMAVLETTLGERQTQ